jgi:hypothetical protein
MQKTEINLGVEYRLITDGKRYRIQTKVDSGWQIHQEMVYLGPCCGIQAWESRWKWRAERKLAALRKAEALRRADKNAIWETLP